MAVAYVASGGAGVGNASSITTSIDAGSADYCVAGAGWNSGGGSRSVSSVSFNGVSLTAVVSVEDVPGARYIGCALYRWPDATSFPASGAHDLVTTMSSSTGDVVQELMSFSGCASTQTGTGATAQGFPSGGGGQPAVTVTGVTNGLVTGFCCDNTAAANLSTAETERVEVNSNVNSDTTLNGATGTFVGSGTMDWTGPNFFQFAATAYPLEPAAAASGGGPIFGTGALVDGALYAGRLAA